MKILLLYSTKSNCSKDCAFQLADLLSNHEVTVSAVGENVPSFSEFDFVVLGGGVRFGKFYPSMRRFLKSRSDELVSVPHALFICCATGEHADEYFDMLYPKALKESAFDCVYFGGSLDTRRFHGIGKIMIAIARFMLTDTEEEITLPEIIDSNISLLATKITALKGNSLS